MSKKHINKEKRIVRSDLSGRAVNGKDVILATEAEEYLKLQGYKLIPPAQISFTVTCLLSFILFGGTILF